MIELPDADELPAHVPAGWSFRRAAEVALGTEVTHAINPANDTHRLTLCQGLREIWLAADRLPASQADTAAELKLYSAVCFEIAKRIGKRQKELRKRLGEA